MINQGVGVNGLGMEGQQSPRIDSQFVPTFNPGQGFRPTGKIKYFIQILVEYDFGTSQGKIISHRSFPARDGDFGYARKPFKAKPKHTQLESFDDGDITI